MPKSPSWSSWVKVYPAKTTTASVFDALEARVEGLYEEHEEAGTERTYRESSGEGLGCHEGYYHVKRVSKNGVYSTTHYKLYVSDANVRRWFTEDDEAFNVFVRPVDKKFLRPEAREKKAYHIELPKRTSGSVTLRVSSRNGERLVQVEHHLGEYPKGVETNEKRKEQEKKRIKNYYACAARAIWARKHSEYEVGFKDATLEVKLAAKSQPLSGTRDP